LPPEPPQKTRQNYEGTINIAQDPRQAPFCGTVR
jgi:hypothetical protein